MAPAILPSSDDEFAIVMCALSSSTITSSVLPVANAPDGGDVDADDLEHGDRRRFDVVGDGDPVFGDGIGRRDLGLAHRHRPQPVELAVVLGDIAGGEDVRIARTHEIVDHDALVDFQPHLGGKFQVGANAGRHQQEITRQHLAIAQRHGANAAFVAPSSWAAATSASVTMDAQPFQIGGQELRCCVRRAGAAAGRANVRAR